MPFPFSVYLWILEAISELRNNNMRFSSCNAAAFLERVEAWEEFHIARVTSWYSEWIAICMEHESILRESAPSEAQRILSVEWQSLFSFSRWKEWQKISLLDWFVDGGAPVGNNTFTWSIYEWWDVDEIKITVFGQNGTLRQSGRKLLDWSEYFWMLGGMRVSLQEKRNLTKYNCVS